MSLTKAKMVATLAANIGMSKREAKDLINMMFETVKSTLARGEDVKLSGLGVFKTRQKPLRLGRHPRTGDEMTISPRRVITFRAGTIFKR